MIERGHGRRVGEVKERWEVHVYTPDTGWMEYPQPSEATAEAVANRIQTEQPRAAVKVCKVAVNSEHVQP